MNFQQLRHFVVTADTGNILKASEVLYISQSGLSRSISALEHKLGLPLFERNAKGVELTSFGRHFYPSARVMLNEHRRSVEELKAFRELKGGSLTIGISHSFAYFLVPDTVSELLRRWPRAAISIVTDNYPALIGGLVTGDLDLAFSLYTPASIRDDLGYETMFEMRTSVYARPDHPFVTGRDLQPEELVNARWALINGASAQSAFEEFFEGRGLSVPEVSLRCASVALLSSIVATTDLLTILPEEIGNSVAGGAMVAIPAVDHFGIALVGLIRRHGAVDYPIAEKFVQLLISQSRQYDGSLRMLAAE